MCDDKFCIESEIGRRMFYVDKLDVFELDTKIADCPRRFNLLKFLETGESKYLKALT